MTLDARLLEILVCPSCRAAVAEADDGTALVCSGCGFRYPIRDGIPIMLIDEADKPPVPGRDAGKPKKGKRR